MGDEELEELRKIRKENEILAVFPFEFHLICFEMGITNREFIKI